MFQTVAGHRLTPVSDSWRRLQGKVTWILTVFHSTTAENIGLYLCLFFFFFFYNYALHRQHKMQFPKSKGLVTKEGVELFRLLSTLCLHKAVVNGEDHDSTHIRGEWRGTTSTKIFNTRHSLTQEEQGECEKWL